MRLKTVVCWRTNRVEKKNDIVFWDKTFIQSFLTHNNSRERRMWIRVCAQLLCKDNSIRSFTDNTNSSRVLCATDPSFVVLGRTAKRLYAWRCQLELFNQAIMLCGRSTEWHRHAFKCFGVRPNATNDGSVTYRTHELFVLTVKDRNGVILAQKLCTNANPLPSFTTILLCKETLDECFVSEQNNIPRF